MASYMYSFTRPKQKMKSNFCVLHLIFSIMGRLHKSVQLLNRPSVHGLSTPLRRGSMISMSRIGTTMDVQGGQTREAAPGEGDTGKIMENMP